VFIGLGAALARLGFGLSSSSDENIQCIETVSFSWTRIRNSMSSILAKGLACALTGLICGLLSGLVSVLVRQLGDQPRVPGDPEEQVYQPMALDFGLLMLVLAFGLVGLVFGLGAAFASGLYFSEIETRAIPNEGIHRSGRSAVVVGTVFGLAAALIFGLVLGPVIARFLFAPHLRVAFVLGGGLAAGLGFGLIAGGEVCINHFVLRLWLIHNGSTPWNYVRFLDYAADRILLRKVGGGYMFIHRMLMEWFAARYVEPAVGGKQPAKPSAIEQQP
jgi:hypothetical protein